MNNDITPKKRPLSQPPQLPRSPQQGASPTSSHLPTAPQAQDTASVEPPLLGEPVKPLLIASSKRRSIKKIVLWAVIGVLCLALLVAGGLYAWYVSALQPVSPGATEKVRLEVVEGSSPAIIGNLLASHKLIRDERAFDIYTKVSGTRSKLQAGVYSLSPSESTQQIVEHLVSGNTDQFTITFLPGATLAENRRTLVKAGYSEQEVDAALNKTYDHPLFAGKPASTDLEGYIYGETYLFTANATVEQILKKTFDEFYSTLQKKQLISAFEKHDLSLYQAITLASIIQREVPSGQDQKQVAQIFYTRLEMDMELGSDVTYQYAAKKMGVPPSPNLESPYNTRKYPGLPPGPIATPGVSALEAVAQPASGDYVYFLSGDNDVTYYGRTLAEHEANIENHCKTKCLLP